MNSLLSFSWRRDKASSQSVKDQNDSRYESMSVLPPVITASNSCDTIGDEADNIKISIARLPTTPEGLRPRRASSFVQRDLGLLSYKWETEKRPPAISQLPPRLTTSWSTQGVISSGSSGGPYSHANSGSRGDAQSPHLLPGHARTAVGALVAMNIAPEHNQRPNEERYRWTPDWGSVCHQAFNDEESPDPTKENEYFALDDSAQNDMRIPVPDPNTNRSFVDSPISKASSLAGSPSSRAHMFCQRGERSKLAENNHINTSFSSQARLIHAANTSFTSRAIQMNSETMGAYDFTPLVDGQEVILSSLEHLTNMSAMSQSALDQESFHIFEPESNFYLMNEDYVPSPQYAHLDYALRKSKSENQRHAKEELIVALVGRLQDNLSFISKMQNLGGLQAGLDDWFMPDRLSQEGLLTGFSEDKRAVITSILAQIVEEMNNATTSDENGTNSDLRDSLQFCKKLVTATVSSSSSEGTGHQRGEWRIRDHVKNCLGMVHPETPEVVRGGDTSVFSLPSGCDDTPMTSNVSLTTTITSAVTTPNGRKSGKAMKPFVDGLVLRRTIDIFCTLLGKLTRSCHTLLNRTPEKWHAGSEASIRVTEEIKRTYLQLLAMEAHDLHALVDSFVYHAVPLGITQEEVFEDDRPKGSFVLPPPPSLANNAFVVQPLPNSSSEETEDARPKRCVEHNLFSPSTEDMRTLHPKDDGYFTDNEDEDGYDDLRRQVGSGEHDNDDNVTESREGPPLHPNSVAPGTPIIHPSLRKMGLTSPMSI